MAPQTTLEVPMQRVSQIVLGRTNASANAFGPWEVRAHVAGGGTVAFELEKWAPDEVSGTSAVFGRLALAPQSIRQLQFNFQKAKLANAESPPGDEFKNLDE